MFKVNDRKQGVCEIGESLLPRFIHLGTNQLFPVMFQLFDDFVVIAINEDGLNPNVALADSRNSPPSRQV